MKDISIIVPCYNEERILEKSSLELMKIFENTTLDYEIIFVDDYSKDKTRNLIKRISKNRPRIRYIFHPKNEGRGKAVKDGLKIAEGEIVGYIDIDLEIPPIYVYNSFLTIKHKGYDMVIADRIYRLNLFSLHRFILGKCYSLLVKILLGLPFNDTEAGLKFFKRNKIGKIVDETEHNGWFWDTEIVATAYKKGMKICNSPTLFIRRPEKKSTVNLIRDSIDYFISLMNFRIKRWKK